MTGLAPAETVPAPGQETRRRDLHLARRAVSFALFIASGGLFYWAFGSPSLPHPLGAAEQLKFNSALAIVCLALAAWVRLPAVRVVALVIAGTIAVLTLAEFLRVPGIDIDQLIVSDPAGGAHPGRMPVATAIAVLVLSLAGALERWRSAGQVCALGAVGVAGVSLVGFAFGAANLTALRTDTTMSVPSALAVTFLGLAALARTPDGWFPWILHGRDAGAVALRRILPAVVLGVPVLSLVHMQGEERYWRDARMAEAGFAVVLVVIGGGLLFAVASSLRVVDRQREQARAELVLLNERLVEQVRENYASLRSAQQRIGALEIRQRAALTAHDDALQTIFASGVVLSSTLASVPGDSALGSSLERTMDAMDDAVRDIRRVIKDLDGA